MTTKKTMSAREALKDVAAISLRCAVNLCHSRDSGLREVLEQVASGVRKLGKDENFLVYTAVFYSQLRGYFCRRSRGPVSLAPVFAVIMKLERS